MFKFAVLLCAVVAINASGYGLGGGRAGGVGPAYGYEAPKPYSFGYDAVGGGGASSRRESGDGSGNVKGSYSLAVGDGRKRTVNYVADDAGFRAVVKTNEQGTDNQDPADVKVIATPSSYAGVQGAYSHGYAGVVAASGRAGIGNGRGLGLGAGYGGAGVNGGAYGAGSGLRGGAYRAGLGGAAYGAGLGGTAYGTGLGLKRGVIGAGLGSRGVAYGSGLGGAAYGAAYGAGLGLRGGAYGAGLGSRGGVFGAGLGLRNGAFGAGLSRSFSRSYNNNKGGHAY